MSAGKNGVDWIKDEDEKYQSKIEREIYLEGNSTIVKVTENGESAYMSLDNKCGTARYDVVEIVKKLYNEVQQKIMIKGIPTKVLVDVLSKRGGVEEEWLDPDEKKQIEFEGPIRILKVID